MQDLDDLFETACTRLGVQDANILQREATKRGQAGRLVPIIPMAGQQWAKRYWSEGMANADPVVHAALSNPNPFLWSTLEARYRQSSAQRLFSACRETLGVRTAYVVPLHSEDGLEGFANFYLCPRQLAAMRLVGQLALERAIILRDIDQDAPSPDSASTKCPLTLRQREVLAYAAAGKSDWDTGRILGISENTVREHIQGARQRLDVRTRQQAIVIAIQRGWIRP
jgi:LuxR family transcriptional regulator, quorum-sensing system regulator BjaR1